MKEIRARLKNGFIYRWLITETTLPWVRESLRRMREQEKKDATIRALVPETE